MLYFYYCKIKLNNFRMFLNLNILAFVTKLKSDDFIPENPSVTFFLLLLSSTDTAANILRAFVKKLIREMNLILSRNLIIVCNKFLFFFFSLDGEFREEYEQEAEIREENERRTMN